MSREFGEIGSGITAGIEPSHRGRFKYLRNHKRLGSSSRSSFWGGSLTRGFMSSEWREEALKVLQSLPMKGRLRERLLK